MTTTATSDTGIPGIVSRGAISCDVWLCESLGGASPDEGIRLARLRGLALGGAATTLAMTAWKVVGPLTAADLFLISAVALLLPRFTVARARKVWVPMLALTLIVIGGVVGTLVASASEVSGSANVLGRLIAASAGAMMLVICWRPGLTQLRSFSWLWVAGGVVSGLVALLIPDLHGFLRPSGLTPHPSHLAVVSVIVFGVALGLVASSWERNELLLGLAASGVLFTAIVASGSRAGLIAAILIVFLALLATRDRRAIVVALGAAVVGLVLVFSGFAGEDNALERLYRGDSPSGEAREAFNDAAWTRFKSHPVTGVGFADARDPHNFFLQMGSSAGLLGLIGATMLVVLALRSYVVAVWKRMAEFPAYWRMAAGLAAAVIGYLAASAFQNVLWDRNVWIAIALMTWAGAASAAQNDGPRNDSPPDL